MPYTDVWNTTRPSGSTTPAAEIDDEIRLLRLQLQERLNTILESMTADPIQLKAISAVTYDHSLAPLAKVSEFINPSRAFAIRFGSAGVATDVNGQVVILKSEFVAPKVVPDFTRIVAVVTNAYSVSNLVPVAVPLVGYTVNAGGDLTLIFLVAGITVLSAVVFFR
jgi:hypothetical protein